MPTVLGIKCKLFRGTAGSTAATEMMNVQDSQLKTELGSADATTHGSGDWEAEDPTLFKGSVTWKMLYDGDDADLQAIQSAFFNKSAIALFASTGDGHGLDADFKIFKFEQDRSMRQNVVMDIEARPTRSTRVPQML